MMVMGDTIDILDLPDYLRAPDERSVAAVRPREAPPAGAESLEDQERRLIAEALQNAGGNQSQAARLLRIGRDALRYKLKKHNLEGKSA